MEWGDEAQAMAIERGWANINRERRYKKGINILY